MHKQGKTKQIKTKVSQKSKTAKATDNVSFWKEFIHSDLSKHIFAVCLFLFSLFCFLSIVSFFVTCLTDYSLVENITPRSLITGESNIHNWCGNLGAFVAYVFIRYTFGIGALGFVVLFVMRSLRMMGVFIKKRRKINSYTFVTMLYVARTFGFLIYCLELENLEYYAGVVGICINKFWMRNMGLPTSLFMELVWTIVMCVLIFGQKALRHWKERNTERYNKRREELQRKYADENPEIVPAEKMNLERGYREKDIPEEEQPDLHSNKTVYSYSDKEVNNNLVTEKSKQTNNSIQNQQDNDATFVIKRDGQAITIDETQQAETETTAEKDNIPFVVKENQQPTKTEDEDNTNTDEKQEHCTIDQPYDPHLDLRDFVIPSTDFLVDYDKKNKLVTETELITNNRRIKETLKNYGIAITSIEATPGPTVTLYEIIPAPGVRISQIKNLADDIALSLAALGIRIIAPIPGKGAIGIEVPNSQPQVVSVKSMIESNEFRNSKAELPIVIGKTVENDVFVTDLAKAPHLLVAGATGQGKSVGLNVIVTSLLYKKHPSELKFVFVDPKKVELSLYSNLERHYLAKIPGDSEAVITDVDIVEKTLRSLCSLMDKRYNLLKDAQCKKITEYNVKFLSRRIPMQNGHGYMPYIVVVIDEFADLIMTTGKKIEEPICRLAQLARAVGIHLIIATQRPSVDIITGKIKANFPARAAFKTSSMVDSKTILDSSGAEQLIGRGDMLFSANGKLTRLQCAMIDTPEIEALVQSICEQQGYPTCFELPIPPKENGALGTDEVFELPKAGGIDPLFEDAAICIVDTQHGSTSTVQRKFAIGYNRAGKIVDQLEMAGIVGPFRGSKPREVLVKTREQLDSILAEFLKSK